MAARSGSEPEFMFGDALCGSGGMSDPIDSTFLSSPLVGEVFPDALSALPLPALTLPALGDSKLPTSAAALQTQAPRQGTLVAPAAPRSVASSRQFAPRRTAPTMNTVPAPGIAPALRTASTGRGGSVPLVPLVPLATMAPPAGRSVPLPPPAGMPTAGWPAPGMPAAVPVVNYAPGYAPVFAPAAPPAGYRPVAGTGYVPVPPSAPYPQSGGPQIRGMADVRAAIAQARQMAAAQRPTAPAPAIRRRKSASGVWSFLVLVVIVLFATGVGQKLISLVSDFLQRK